MKSIAAVFFTLILAACSEAQNMGAPHVFGPNEVPPEVLNEPRLVEKPAPLDRANTPWPRLGDVPSMPANFTPHPLIQQTMQQLEDQRAEAEAKKEEVENAPPEMPASNVPTAAIP